MFWVCPWASGEKRLRAARGAAAARARDVMSRASGMPMKTWFSPGIRMELQKELQETKRASMGRGVV